MKLNSKHITDWDLLAKYLSNETSEEENSEIEKWIESSEENAQIFEQVKMDWESFSIMKETEKVDVDLAWDNLYNRIKEDDKPVINLEERSGETRSVLFPLIKYAAIIIFIAVIGGLYTVFKSDVDIPDSYLAMERSTQEGDKFIELADGSIVYLNSETKLFYPNKFSDSERKVYLEGEAFFEIAKDASKPFIIETDAAHIQVLGTSFNVNTEVEDKDLEVIVSTGKVKVYKKNNKLNNVFLEKGDVGVVVKNSIDKYVNKDENFLSWKTKHMVFKEDKLFDIINTINKTYNANIHFENEEIGQLDYTATFENDSIERILNVICASLDLKFEKTPDGYKLFMTSI